MGKSAFLIQPKKQKTNPMLLNAMLRANVALRAEHIFEKLSEAQSAFSTNLDKNKKPVDVGFLPVRTTDADPNGHTKNFYVDEAELIAIFSNVGVAMYGLVRETIDIRQSIEGLYIVSYENIFLPLSSRK